MKNLKSCRRLCFRLPALFLFLMAWILLSASQSPAQTVLLETEAFTDRGGWALDQQFMDQMGSPFLLAHGLGIPVQDAATTTVLDQAAVWHVWVRTRDWVETWGAPGDPGRFQVLLNGSPLPTTFGAEGAAWHWQSGGSLNLSAGEISVALHDVTGFEGRCDAIVLTRDAGLTPPNADPEMLAFRRGLLGIPAEPQNAGTYDLVIIGGGTAGSCAAVAAARNGVRVALVQDRPILGGNNSSEVRVGLGGEIQFEPYPRIGDILHELDSGLGGNAAPASHYNDDKKMAVVLAEENITLLLNHRANEVEMDAGRISAVIAQDTRTGERHRVSGRWFADCTGDATIGYLAGADHEMTLPAHMGRSNLWRVVNTGQPTTFPECPWALNLEGKPLPSGLGQWFWESGFDHDPFEKAEYIRDWNLRAMYGAWDSLKNDRGQYATHIIEWAAYVAGKRESRRLLGDLILTEDDLLNSVAYLDGSVPTSWSIDVHIPDDRYDEGFEGDAFISVALFTQYPRPYWVPYRCFYSRNIPNLFMAGRNISVTHQALGTVRVMRTTGMMGEIVGMAASLCLKNDCDPRAVYTDYLDELKKLMDPPNFWDVPGYNCAPQARVDVSGYLDAEVYPAHNVNDGHRDTHDNTQRWVSDPSVPGWVTLEWDSPRALHAARILTGYNNGSVTDAIRDFRLQYWNGRDWQDIPGASVTANTQTDWRVRFDPTTTTAIRLYVTATPGNYTRIWEIETYQKLESGAEVCWALY
ncbi:FAD-dependent oxidoreductase [bacterium]|nr:FAD-dependent oxidoreductase [bacterium]